MRKLIATVFNYSVDGLLADPDTDFWTFCFSLPENNEPDDPAQLDFLRSAYAHIMGRTAYESISRSMTTATDHPFSDILNAGRKVVILPDPEDGRVGQHHHRRRRHDRGDRQAQARALGCSTASPSPTGSS